MNKKMLLPIPIIIIAMAIGAIYVGGQDQRDAEDMMQGATDEMVEAWEDTSDNSSAEEKSISSDNEAALSKAESYAIAMYMSKKAIYDQLVSVNGENFSKEAAQYAIDNIVADWNNNALEKSRKYQESGMSKNSIKEQLISKYGEKFTKSQANYAIKHLK